MSLFQTWTVVLFSFYVLSYFGSIEEEQKRFLIEFTTEHEGNT